MINLSLSSSDLKKYQQSLITGYNLKITIQILDLNHTYIDDVSDRLLTGQVNKDFFGVTTTNATLDLLDPDNQVGFDTTNPSEGAIYADRMIKIIYSVFSDLLPRWVDVPVFCGPVIKVSRDGAILSVECQGKESLYVEPMMAWTAKTYAKGTKLVSAVRDLLTNKGGETRFDLPEWTRTLKKDIGLKVEKPVWDMTRDLVGSRLIQQVFYDGRGYLRLRTTPTTPTFTFTEDWLTSVPKLDFDSDSIRNTVRVKGATPTGKAQIIANAELPASDANSATSLGRKLANGTVVKRHLVELVDDSAIATQKEADDQAKTTLDSLDLQNVNFEFDSFPVPHLEQGDIFQITTRSFSRSLRATQFSIPLLAGESQSNGVVKQVVPTTRKKRS
jgi:hypothetical protein